MQTLLAAFFGDRYALISESWQDVLTARAARPAPTNPDAPSPGQR